MSKTGMMIGQRVFWLSAILLALLTGCAAVSPTGASTAHPTPPPATFAPPGETPDSPAAIPDWLWNARIATADSADWDEWTAQVDAAVANGATVILGWDRFQGTEWQTLYEPALSEALTETQQRAHWIHQNYPGVRYIIYMAPLEATTEGIIDEDGQMDPDQEDRSIAIQHPDWAQVGLDGRKAVFYGSLPGMPFWVCSTCEDVWLTPANAEFRALVVEQFRRLAAETELDGVWHDVPFLMGGYFGEGWPEGQFPDVGAEARARFAAETGYSLSAPPLTADWDDAAWQRFIAWRYALINGYLADIRDAVAAENPDFAFIPESSVGFDAMLTQLAASPVDLPTYVHTTAHELGGTERPVQYYTWLWFLSTLQAWRHLDLAYGEPSWLLSYVEAGHADTRDLARLHAAATELSGFRTLTSGDEGMTAPVDEALYRDLYAWLARNAPLADPNLRPAANVAVLFSQQTLDFVGRGDWETDYAADFAGTLMALLESHIPFQVLADDDLDRLGEFQAAILPGTECLSDGQAEQVRAYVNGGGRLLATGYTSRLNEYGNARSELALADVFDTTLAEIEADESIVHENAYGDGYAVLSPEPHELWYYWAADPESLDADPATAEAERAAFLGLLDRLNVDFGLRTDAPRQVILLPYRTAAGEAQVGVINLVGVGPSNAVPTPQTFTVTLTLPAAARSARMTIRAPAPDYDPARAENVTATWAEIFGAAENVTPEVEGNRVTVPLGVRVGGLLRVESTAATTPALYLPLLLRNEMALTDPRETNHGIVSLPFTAAGRTGYYVTWSSASTAWEHDIYRQTVHFENGLLTPDTAPQRYIGNGADEAQEPVGAAINSDGVILTAWEDGSGDSVDVRGQLHRPEGSIIRANRVIAGGAGSQHSVAVSPLGVDFLVAYADEAAPAQYAMVRAQVISGRDGISLHRLALTAPEEDNWWPVTASDGSRHAFVGWGDGERFSGAVVTVEAGGVSQTPGRTYISGIAQYHYHVAWIEPLASFLAVARTGEDSTACLIGLDGKAATCSGALPPLVREANLAVQGIRVVYPTGERDLALLRVTASAIIPVETISGAAHPALQDITWPSTGVWSRFAQDEDSRTLPDTLFIAMNRPESNEARLLAVALPSSSW